MTLLFFTPISPSGPEPVVQDTEADVVREPSDGSVSSDSELVYYNHEAERAYAVAEAVGAERESQWAKQRLESPRDAFVPLGSPVFLATTWPLSAKPLNQLMLAQDTGSAIRGAVRADFFWGYGDEAGREAGRMKQALRMWLLLPRGYPVSGIAD